MRIESSVVVNRPVDEVWAFATDLFNQPRLGGGALALRQTSPGPIGVGSTFQSRRVILGFEATISGAITEWDPPRGITGSFTGAGMRSGSLRATLEATADGSKLVRSVEAEPRPTLKLLWWIAWPFLRRQMDAEYRNLKRLLEAGQG